MKTTFTSFLMLASLWVCTARSVIGRVYSADGPDEAEARAAALNECQQGSFVCYITRCEQAEDDEVLTIEDQNDNTL